MGRRRRAPKHSRLPVAAGLVIGYLADLAFGDAPTSQQPVAALGRVAERIAARTYADTRAAGAMHLAAVAGGAAATTWIADRLTRRHPVVRATLSAAVTWAALAGRPRSGDPTEAVVAPLVWGAMAGPTGIVAHRAVGTVNAMTSDGVRRYERFGWAAARADDAMGLVPSRVTGLLEAALNASPPELDGEHPDRVEVSRRVGFAALAACAVAALITRK